MLTVRKVKRRTPEGHTEDAAVVQEDDGSLGMAWYGPAAAEQFAD